MRRNADTKTLNKPFSDSWRTDYYHHAQVLSYSIYTLFIYLFSFMYRRNAHIYTYYIPLGMPAKIEIIVSIVMWTIV